MKKNKKAISREIGLEIASICGRYFLKLEHLHYGYWPGDLEVDLANLPKAQENYVDLLISNIPKGVKTILDVGSGMGQIAHRLALAGYKVDCVSPSPVFAQHIRDLLGEKSRVFECYYEQLETGNQYDLVLFCESFQYINPDKAIKKTVSLLGRDGFMIIYDIFKVDTEEKSPLAGGHKLSGFFQIISGYPLSLITDLDITEQTAPNIDIENRMFKEVFEPVGKLLDKLVESRYPVLSKILKWRYRKKIEKLKQKYFSSQRTGENFRKFKSYRFLLYRKNTG